MVSRRPIRASDKDGYPQRINQSSQFGLRGRYCHLPSLPRPRERDLGMIPTYVMTDQVLPMGLSAWALSDSRNDAYDGGMSANPYAGTRSMRHGSVSIIVELLCDV